MLRRVKMNSREEFEQNRTYYLNVLPKECANCGETNDLDIHHTVPLAKGGTNRISNLVMLCLECHGKIHDVNRVKHKELQRIGIEKAKERKYVLKQELVILFCTK